MKRLMYGRILFVTIVSKGKQETKTYIDQALKHTVYAKMGVDI